MLIPSLGKASPVTDPTGQRCIAASPALRTMTICRETLGISTSM
jgi:hypothetical protein